MRQLIKVISMYFRLQSVRENNELTQKQVADILKVSQASYSRWEKEIEIIPLRKLILFAEYFNLSLDYICNFSNKRELNSSYKIDKTKVGNRLVEFRNKNNITQKELAVFLNTTPSTICAYEKGKTLLLTSFAYQICTTYKISMDYLCGLEDR